ncbi:hypothetical protein V5O48_008185 [Marasmius crinis-equi]|uniref:F-box domain-containing protein n=1 Tax=Marasmius crinis-equi TaxID=585013 RepID=A0ABR3FEN4_9AGAR
MSPQWPHAMKALPNELLILIFNLSIPPEGATFICSSLPRLFSQAMVLSQVCSSWRELTLSTGELWDTITISPVEDEEEGTILPERPLLLHLERSRRMPLAITVSRPFRGLGEKSMSQERFHALLAKNSTRLRHLHLHHLDLLLKVIDLRMLAHKSARANGSNTDSDIQHTLRFPLLESLSFKAPTGDYNQLHSLLQRTSFPSLKSLSILDYTARRPFTQSFSLPYRQIRSLQFRVHEKLILPLYNSTTLPEILSSCSFITKLDLELTANMGYPEALTIPCLTDLTIQLLLTEQAYKGATRILSVVICPALKSLSIRGRPADNIELTYGFLSRRKIQGDLFKDGIIPLLEKSNCALDRLNVHKVLVSSSSLMLLLRARACLTLLHLLFREVEIDFLPSPCSSNLLDQLLAELVAHPNDPGIPVLPPLRTIHITMTGSSQTVASLASIVESRTESLESAVFEIPDHLAAAAGAVLNNDTPVAVKVLGYPSGSIYVGYENRDGCLR